MSWFFGAGMGFLLGGPLGAVVGGAIQHFATGARDAAMRGGDPNQETVFITYLVSIMTKIAMADGRIAQQEVQSIHRFFAEHLRFSGMEMRYVDSLIHETQRVDPDLSTVARSFRSGSNYESCLMLLDICYQIAMSDGVYSDPEDRALKVLADALGIGPDEAARMKRKYNTGRTESHAENTWAAPHDDYAILGIPHTAGNDEVKKAYRQMAAQYHPDKVAHLGKELVDFANQKFAQINKAHDNIKKSRGMS